MKIATWNVNSIRKRIDHILQWIKTSKVDVLCLQETKVIDEKFPIDEFKNIGYKVVFKGEKQFNGVAVVYKVELKNFTYTIDDFLDNEARFIYFEYQDLFIYTSYFPNGTDVTSERFNYKINYFESLLEMIDKRHTKNDKILVIGDFNIAPSEIDVYDVDEIKGQIAFHPKEHEVLQKFFDFGFEDLYRVKYPSKTDAYSWWDYRKGAFQKNNGLRIDLLLTTRNLTDIATECYIDVTPRTWESPSDHVPVLGVFDI